MQDSQMSHNTKTCFCCMWQNLLYIFNLWRDTTQNHYMHGRSSLIWVCAVFLDFFGRRLFVCLFDLMLYVPVNNYVGAGLPEFSWTSTKLELMCLIQGCNTVRLEPEPLSLEAITLPLSHWALHLLYIWPFKRWNTSSLNAWKKQSDLGLCCLSGPFWQAISVRNSRKFTV